MEGVKLKFEIWTDHKNLEYFMSSQNLNHRQVRWALYLSRFNFTLKHVPGSKMGKADGLSRRSNWEKGEEGDNKERTLLKPEWVQSIQAGEVIVEGIDILENIRKSEAKDDKVIKAVEEMKKAGVKTLRDKEWREKDGLMLKEGKVYVPKDEILRVEIIRLYHNMPMGGYGGQWKTAKMVT